jgi:uncharacterized protein (DUF2147 family)
VKAVILAGALALAAFQVSRAQTPPEAPSSPTGLWSLDQGKAEVEITICGEALCGQLISAAKIRANPDLEDKKNSDPVLKKRKVKGLTILRGFTGGPWEWRGGAVYNPDDGGTYHGVIRLIDGQTLKLTGCIIWPLCKSVKLHRTAGPTDQQS